MFTLRTVNLRLHACGDILTEHPKLHALAHQHPVHKNGCIPFLWNIVVHELRKIDVRCNRQIVLVYGKAAVSLGVLDISLRISGVRRADIHNGSEGGSLADCLFFLLQTGERLVFCRAEIALCVVLICHCRAPFLCVPHTIPDDAFSSENLELTAADQYQPFAELQAY